MGFAGFLTTARPFASCGGLERAAFATALKLSGFPRFVGAFAAFASVAGCFFVMLPPGRMSSRPGAADRSSALARQ